MTQATKYLPAVLTLIAFLSSASSGLAASISFDFEEDGVQGPVRTRFRVSPGGIRNAVRSWSSRAGAAGGAAFDT